ncbi:MAG: hypothetical protein LQ346_007235 [Caloplaca aetnensis]|nr:MAG: hypothetical protein LQ346_007235 [Caloplaca aetnensis]
MSSALISLPYACTHTAPFLVCEISPAAYDAKYASGKPHSTAAELTGKDERDEPATILFAPVGQVESVVALLTGAGVWGEMCPACLRKEEEGEEQESKGENGWVLLKAGEGEVLFDVEDHGGNAELDQEMVGDEEKVDADPDANGGVVGWWDILDLEAEDAEAEAESDGEADGFDPAALGQTD